MEWISLSCEWALGCTGASILPAGTPILQSSRTESNRAWGQAGQNFSTKHSSLYPPTPQSDAPILERPSHRTTLVILAKLHFDITLENHVLLLEQMLGMYKAPSWTPGIVLVARILVGWPQGPKE